MLGILHDAKPRRAVDRPGEAIDLERGRRDESPDIAVARVHDHDRAGLALHGMLGRLLDAAVDRRDDLRARMRIGVLDHTHGPAQRIDFDALTAVAAS